MKLQYRAIRVLIIVLILVGFLFPLTQSIAQQKITSPENYFGFQMGADRQLARWDKIVDYFYQVEQQSDRIKVVNMGPSAEGHPFLVLFISSAENLQNLDRLQEINKKITNPKGVTEDEIKTYVKEGKAIVIQSMSLHASEVGGTQMTPELTYDLLSRNDLETQRILDNVIFIMIPSLNPDGQVMITDWYKETLGTEFEGMNMPYLYHKYCGHDNNRDGDYLNLQESKYLAKVMFVDWSAQAYIDHHHMGSYGARFYVPPYCDPIRPYADPLVWREISWYGSHIAYKLEEQGFKGVLNAAQFAGWGHFGWHWITPFHNIAGMLTESANAKLATPLYIQPEQLKAGSRMFPEYEAQSTFPNPWEGGWWKLRTIVEQQKSSAWSLLDLAARNKKMVLRTAYLKAKNQTERGLKGDLKTVIIPANQHDYLTSVKMINTLLRSGIEIKKAKEDFVVEGMSYKKGSYVISLAQPKMGLIRNLLAETHYADNAWTRKEDGTPLRPYDLATHTMYEFMGVKVDALKVIAKGEFETLNDFDKPNFEIKKSEEGYVLDGRQNQSYQAVNLLLNKGVKIHRVEEAFMSCRPGDFLIKMENQNTLKSVSNETNVNFMPLENWPSKGMHKVKRARIALFQRYDGGNMDEGWTRLCLEKFSFDYHTLMNNEIKKGKLKDKFDVIIIPSDSYAALLSNYPEDYPWRPEKAPEKYKSGFDDEGVNALKEFVNDGGTLVSLGESYKFIAEKFELKVKNVLEGLSKKEFFCPGSTVKATFDNTDPLAYGMPDRGLVLFSSSAAFEIIPSRQNDDYKTIVRYGDKDLLKSGWLIGEKKMAKKSAMISATYGEGRIILIGFRAQHRNQTDATFKLLFNTIIE